MGAQNFNGIGAAENRTHRDSAVILGAGSKGNYIVGAETRDAANLQHVVGYELRHSRGDNPVVVRTIARGATLSVTDRPLNVLSTGTRVRGQVGATEIVPGTFSATDGVFTATDDGAGNIEIAAVVVGTINYRTGVVDFAAAVAAGAVLEVDFDHKGFHDLVGDADTFLSVDGAGTDTQTDTLGERVVPGGIRWEDDGVGAAQVILEDDGLGNVIVIQAATGTVGATAGTIDYDTGAYDVTITGETIDTKFTVSFNKAEWSVQLAPGGASHYREVRPSTDLAQASRYALATKGHTALGWKGTTTVAGDEGGAYSVSPAWQGDGGEFVKTLIRSAVFDETAQRTPIQQR